jgi:hypothetical protein
MIDYFKKGPTAQRFMLLTAENKYLDTMMSGSKAFRRSIQGIKRPGEGKDRINSAGKWILLLRKTEDETVLQVLYRKKRS